ITADGRWVVFTSAATNLVSDDSNGLYDVFVHDMKTGVTQRVSVASDGSQGDGGEFGQSGSGNLSQAISVDGRYIVYTSGSNNLVAHDTNVGSDVFVRDMHT